MSKYQRNDLLQKVNNDILQAGIMLEQTPVYEYADGDVLNVVFVGEFEALYTYVSFVATTAQVLDKPLKIHIVSSDMQFSEKLLRKAPLLVEYSNLGGEVEEPYVEFYFYSSLSETKSLAHRYAIVASECASTIQNTLKALVKMYSSESDKKAIVNYVCPDTYKIETPKHITLNHLEVGRHRKVIDRLGEMAFRLHYLYMKESDPQYNYEKCREEFSSDGYSQTSSLASILHCKYKLNSIGINPRSTKSNVIKVYDKIVFCSDKSVWNSLVYLEHKRWMLYTMFAGYNNPTLEQINKYAYVNGNYRWRSDKLKLHNCLVPCARNTGFALQNLSPNEWEVSDTAIEEMDLDPMDKMSLRVHSIAKKKMALSKVAVESELRTLQTLLAAAEASADCLESMELFRDRIAGLFMGKNLQFTNDFFEDIEKAFSDCAVPGESNLLTIRNHLKIVEEFYGYHDFKLADRLIVDDLLFILYANKVTLIKLVSDRVLDNIAGPLILEPENLAYVSLGSVNVNEYRDFFKKRGDNTSVSAYTITEGDAIGIRKQLELAVNNFDSHSCVIDVTGASPLLIAAAVQIAQHNASIGIICSDAKEQRIVNIQNFVEALVYREKHSLSTSEAYGLFGAAERKDISKDNSYLLDLVNAIPKAWNLYNQVERRAFEGICHFFSYFSQNSTLVSWRYPIDPYDREMWQDSVQWDFRWTLTQYEFGEDYLQSSHLRNVFLELEKHELVKDLSFQTSKGGIVQVKFYIQNAFRGALNKFINEMKNERYEVVCHEVLDKKYNVKMQNIGIRARNSNFFKAYVSDTLVIRSGNIQVAEYDLDKELYPWLQKLQEYDLIRNLRRTDKSRGADIQFEFVGASNDTVRAMFDKTGTILELFAWHEALQQKCFYDIRPNFGFYWDDEAVSNELDLILTRKGSLQTAVISCKTSAIKREHIYEVLYLAERFSLNSKAAIIYTRNRFATEDAPNGFDRQQNMIPLSETERQRIKAMGVELIILEELGEKTLGDVLEKLFV